MSELISGPLGRHARTGPPYRTWWTPVRVMIGAVAVASALSLLTFSHCVRTGWKSPDMYVHFCYSEVSNQFGLYATVSIVALALTTLLLSTLTPRWTDALLLTAAPAVVLTLFIGRESLVALMVVLALFLAKRAKIDPTKAARVLLILSLIALLATKSDRPQYVLVITPLVILAGINRRDFYLWQGAEVIYQILLWQSVATINGAPKGLPASANDVAIWIHMAGAIYLIARTVELFSTNADKKYLK